VATIITLGKSAGLAVADQQEAAVAEAPVQEPAVQEPAVKTARSTKADKRNKPKRQPPYHVILWNDNDHSYAYVVAMLQKLFGHPQEKGYQLAKEVDTRGKAVVLTTTREHAELKRDQIHAFGKDDLIDGCKGSMSSTIEPAIG
jgi:ATP-dependent Clp protease adaptor protein ClpS